MLSAERQDRHQIVLQAALGAIAGVTRRDLGKIRPPTDEKEFAGENMVHRRGWRSRAVGSW
jgi:hypothetical protein